VIYFLIINYYSTDLIQNLIKSLENQNLENYQIIIINNSPEAPIKETLNADYIKIIDNQENCGFGKACNLGLKLIYQQDQTALVWLINPDTYFQEINLNEVILFFKIYPEISILGTIINTPEQKIWFGGGKFNKNLGQIKETNLFSENPHQNYLECDWVSGCSMMINLNKFENCPQFDPAYFLYYEDFDFCQRYLQKGHKIAITNQFQIIHQPSMITNRNLTNKMFHSTYSYLLTLAKYTNFVIFSYYLIKLLINTIWLSFSQPSVALGKIKGVCFFLQKIIFH
jgi:N-acetylglucosaminyl-diphospho-decaprenol L-rhamnosyltransferase